MAPCFGLCLYLTLLRISPSLKTRVSSLALYVSCPGKSNISKSRVSSRVELLYSQVNLTAQPPDTISPVLSLLIERTTLSELSAFSHFPTTLAVPRVPVLFSPTEVERKAKPAQSRTIVTKAIRIPFLRELLLIETLSVCLLVTLLCWAVPQFGQKEVPSSSCLPHFGQNIISLLSLVQYYFPLALA